MRQALVLGSKPLLMRGKKFPSVPLEAGGWRIDCENIVDSMVRLTYWKRLPASDGNGEFNVPNVIEIRKGSDIPLLSGPITITAEIGEAGKEDHISVYATRLN